MADGDSKAFSFFLYVLVAVLAGVAVLMAAVDGVKLLNSGRMVLEGPPAKSALARAEGRLVYREPCRRSRSGTGHQGLTIESVDGLKRIAAPCLIDEGLFERSRDRRIAVLFDDRRFASPDVYEIVFDGVSLLAYEDHAETNRSNARSAVVSDLVAAALVLVGVFYVVRLFVRDQAWHAAGGDPRPGVRTGATALRRKTGTGIDGRG